MLISSQTSEDSERITILRDKRPNMLQVLKRFWPLVLAAVNGGMLLFALILWVLAYFVDVHHLGIDKAAIISTLFPMAGTIGTLSVSWLVAGPFCCKEIGFAIKIFIGISCLLIILSTVSSLIWISTILLVLIGSILYGVETIITTILPMVLSDRREISTVAELIDFAFNIGASLAVIVIGTIVDRFSWPYVFMALAIAAGLTAFFLTIFAWWLKRAKDVQSKPASQEI